MGDARKAVAIHVDPSICAAMPMIAFRLVPPSFGRVMFSCGELMKPGQRKCRALYDSLAV
jgi:hypothetical protein